jgi:hypothetical protein
MPVDPGKLKELHTPNLLLLGGNSPEFVRRATEMLQETLQNVKTVILDGQQHVAMETAPEMLQKEVLSFLLA